MPTGEAPPPDLLALNVFLDACTHGSQGHVLGPQSGSPGHLTLAARKQPVGRCYHCLRIHAASLEWADGSASSIRCAVEPLWANCVRFHRCYLALQFHSDPCAPVPMTTPCEFYTYSLP